MSTPTELGGTIQLPDGRTIPVVISLDVSQIGIDTREHADFLLLRAVEVFGKTEKARSWLNSPNPELKGQTPRSAAVLPEGRERVLGILLDLEHGFPA